MGEEGEGSRGWAGRRGGGRAEGEGDGVKRIGNLACNVQSGLRF